MPNHERTPIGQAPTPKAAANAKKQVNLTD